MIYFNKVGDEKFEVLDGQQRITSIGRFVTNKFAIMEGGDPKYFDSLPADQRAVIQSSTLLIYECEGLEKEIKDWFETINIGWRQTRTPRALECYLFWAVRDTCES